MLTRIPLFLWSIILTHLVSLCLDSLDFIGVNSYYGWSACDGVPEGAADPSYERDMEVIIPESHDQNYPPSDFQVNFLLRIMMYRTTNDQNDLAIHTE